VLYDLEPGVIGALRASPLGELFRTGNPVNKNAVADNNWAKGHYSGWLNLDPAEVRVF
jgi:tubulin beta